MCYISSFDSRTIIEGNVINVLVLITSSCISSDDSRTVFIFFYCG